MDSNSLTTAAQGVTKRDRFPRKLQAILANSDEFGDIISWNPDGKSWKVHDNVRFENEVMGKFFDTKKWSSFARQINGWGFQKGSNKGSNTNRNSIGCYYHDLFTRDNPDLCERMKRQSKSRSSSGGGGSSPSSNSRSNSLTSESSSFREDIAKANQQLGNIHFSSELETTAEESPADAPLMSSGSMRMAHHHHHVSNTQLNSNHSPPTTSYLPSVSMNLALPNTNCYNNNQNNSNGSSSTNHDPTSLVYSGYGISAAQPQSFSATPSTTSYVVASNSKAINSMSIPMTMHSMQQRDAPNHFSSTGGYHPHLITNNGNNINPSGIFSSSKHVSDQTNSDMNQGGEGNNINNDQYFPAQPMWVRNETKLSDGCDAINNTNFIFDSSLNNGVTKTGEEKITNITELSAGCDILALDLQKYESSNADAMAFSASSTPHSDNVLRKIWENDKYRNPRLLDGIESPSDSERQLRGMNFEEFPSDARTDLSLSCQEITDFPSYG